MEQLTAKDRQTDMDNTGSHLSMMMSTQKCCQQICEELSAKRTCETCLHCAREENKLVQMLPRCEDHCQEIRMMKSVAKCGEQLCKKNGEKCENNAALKCCHEICNEAVALKSSENDGDAEEVTQGECCQKNYEKRISGAEPKCNLRKYCRHCMYGISWEEATQKMLATERCRLCGETSPVGRVLQRMLDGKKTRQMKDMSNGTVGWQEAILQMLPDESCEGCGERTDIGKVMLSMLAKGDLEKSNGKPTSSRKDMEIPTGMASCKHEYGTRRSYPRGCCHEVVDEKIYPGTCCQEREYAVHRDGNEEQLSTRLNQQCCQCHEAEDALQRK